MISPPSAAISGKPKVCVGDTTTYTNFLLIILFIVGQQLAELL